MFKYKFHLSLTTLVLMFATSHTAQAQASSKTGWGVSAGIGSSTIKDEDGTDTFSGNAIALSFDVEYRFTENFALGGGLFSLGEADDTFGAVDTEISVGGLDLFTRFILPISDSVDVYGRLGAAVYFVDITPGGVSLDDLFGEDAVELGIGVDFARQENLAFRLEGRFFNGGSDETGTMLTLGINYLFR